MTIHDGTDTIAVAVDKLAALDWTRAIPASSPATGKTNAAALAATRLRAELAAQHAAHRETCRRYALLLAAAQAAVIESRTSRRSPITPISEALTEIGALPAPGTRLSALPLATDAVWPRGSEAVS